MSTIDSSRVRIPRKLVPQVLEAARNGSVNDLERLANNVLFLPYSFYSGLLDIFLLHLKSELLSDGTEEARSATAKELKQAFVSLKGIYILSGLEHFSGSPYFTKRLFEGWTSDVEMTIQLFRHAVERDDSQDRLRRFMNYITGILERMLDVDTETFKRACRQQESFTSFQRLLSTLWLRYSGEEISILGSLANLQAIFLLENGRIGAYAAYVAASFELRIVAVRAIMPFNVLATRSRHKKWNSHYIRPHCAVMRLLMNSEAHSIARSIIDYGGVDVILNVLGSIIKHVSIDAMEDDDFGVIMESLLFLSGCFKYRMRLLRKCLRRGLVKALSYVRGGPFPDDEDVRNDLKMILISDIPRDLANVKTIYLMADIASSLSREERSRIYGGPLGPAWKDMELVLIERMTMLQIDMKQCHGIRRCCSV